MVLADVALATAVNAEAPGGGVGSADERSVPVSFEQALAKTTKKAATTVPKVEPIERSNIIVKPPK